MKNPYCCWSLQTPFACGSPLSCNPVSIFPIKAKRLDFSLLIRFSPVAPGAEPHFCNRAIPAMPFLCLWIPWTSALRTFRVRFIFEVEGCPMNYRKFSTTADLYQTLAASNTLDYDNQTCFQMFVSASPRRVIAGSPMRTTDPEYEPVYTPGQFNITALFRPA